MSLLTVLLVGLCLLVLLPVLVLAFQVLLADVGAGDAAPPVLPGGRAPQVCILMPAHNEALGVAPILVALLAQLDANTRVLLVADNCTDATADLARSVPAEAGRLEVIERHDPTRRGKGFALDFGVQHLRQQPPDVVVILDADCTLEHGALAQLVAQCVATGRPTQALYLMRCPPGAPAKSRIAELAWRVKNWVRPLGYHRLGWPCQLMGSGMAFGWQQISTAALASGHLVEDMQLGVTLALKGTPALFCPQARVASDFPSSAAGQSAQRTRWEHGHLSVIASELPRLLAGAWAQRDLSLLALALDLSVPPLALLSILVLLAHTLTGLWAVFTQIWLPLLLAALAFVLLLVSVGLAWWRFGRDVLSLAQLCRIPWYVLGKLPLYVYFFIRRQTGWVRSRREGE